MEDDFGFDIKSGRYFRLLLVSRPRSNFVPSNQHFFRKRSFPDCHWKVILAVVASCISFAVDRGAEMIQTCRGGVEEMLINMAGQAILKGTNSQYLQLFQPVCNDFLLSAGVFSISASLHFRSLAYIYVILHYVLLFPHHFLLCLVILLIL